MIRKIWSAIIKSWDTFWESYETDDYEHGTPIMGFDFFKPPLY